MDIPRCVIVASFFGLKFFVNNRLTVLDGMRGSCAGLFPVGVRGSDQSRVRKGEPTMPDTRSGETCQGYRRLDRSLGVKGLAQPYRWPRSRRFNAGGHNSKWTTVMPKVRPVPQPEEIELPPGIPLFCDERELLTSRAHRPPLCEALSRVESPSSMVHLSGITDLLPVPFFQVRG